MTQVLQSGQPWSFGSGRQRGLDETRVVSVDRRQQSGWSSRTLLLRRRRNEVESKKLLSRGSQEEVGGHQGGTGHLGARQWSNAREGKHGASAGFSYACVTEEGQA